MMDKNPLVLVIDDEEALCIALQDVLALGGFTALTATNAREGVQIFAEHADEIGVVLLDLIMPELRGEEVLQELLKIRPEVPVVMMSAFLGTREVEHFTEQGFSGFLPKPFDSKDVIAKVKEMLGQE
jgi:DNA-binding NtrC family response regulator